MLEILIIGHMIVIDYQICCSAPNFIKIGSRFGPRDDHNR